MTTLFEFSDALLTKKLDLTEDLTFDKDFNPFIINRAIAQHRDTVMFAGEIQKYPLLSKEMIYKFYLHAIPAKKRYGKWAKKTVLPEQEDLDAIIEFYQVSQERAIEYLEILTKEQIDAIHSQVFKGGRK